MTAYHIPNKAADITIVGFQELEAVPEKQRDGFASRILTSFTQKELAESVVAASACELIEFRPQMLISMLTDKGAFNRHLKVNHNVFIAFQLGFLKKNYNGRYDEIKRRVLA